jgi:hypothetical protein
MALNVWTKSSGYNLGSTDGITVSVESGNFIPGLKYIIRSVGSTDFTKIGAPQNAVGVIFTATNTGSTAGPLVTVNESAFQIPSAGSGIAQRIAFSEQQPCNIQLPVNEESGVTYQRISGNLPPGLRLEGSSIVGTPTEVARPTEFTFCIRASKGLDISDRTFVITIEGSDTPEFITPEGNLNLGDPGELFVMDSTFVDYQLQAVDSDTGAGQRLSYFIATGDGELPPGLILTTDGRIVGFVQPALSIKENDGDGTFDNGSYDSVAFDFAFRPTNGYDSYTYDNVFFDFFLPSRKPKKLNRTYQFTVTVTDGDTSIKRSFKIFVVGDDYFRADNTTWLNGDALFTSDVTYIRNPMWLTNGYLGKYRANNYVTLILDTYDTENIIYSLEQINANTKATTKRATLADNVKGSYTITTTLTNNVPTIGHFLSFAGIVTEAFRVNRVENVVSLGGDNYRLTMFYPLEANLPDNISFLIGTLSTLPPGMSFDENNAEVFGTVPYQPAITKSYTFTVTATKISGKVNTAEQTITPLNVGTRISEIRIDKLQNLNIANILKDITMLVVDGYEIDPAFISFVNYSSPSEVVINLSTRIVLRVDSNVSIKYTQSLGERANTSKIFTVDILGEVESAINWITDPNLLTISTNYISTLSLEANSTIDGSTILYNITSGSLPTGLSLDLDGEIVGKVSTDSPTGVYEFTVLAQDQFGYSAISRDFTLTVVNEDEKLYSNIRVKPFLKTSQRSLWNAFIDNTSVFSPNSIYRPNDANFGIQRELSMLILAGVETKEAAAYISAMGLNHKKKQFHFGEVKKAVALKPGTYSTVYEVIYVEMLDPLEPNGKRLPNKLTNLSQQPTPITADTSNIIWSRQLNDLTIDAPNSVRPENIITANSAGYEVSNPNVSEYFPNSISNWRDQFYQWQDQGESFAIERNYLPLWMRSIQPGSKQELDFKLAVPLCYCKPGTADDILLNIKNYLRTTNFQFNQLSYTADRYIIDSMVGETSDKYLVFRNDRITI